MPRVAPRPLTILALALGLGLAWSAPAEAGRRAGLGWREASRQVIGGPLRGAQGVRLAASTPDPAATTAFVDEARRRYEGPHARRFAKYHPTFVRLFRAADQIRAAGGLSGGAVNGLLPRSAAWNALRHRRSLNPERFDRANRRLGAILALDAQVRELLVRESPGPPASLGVDPTLLNPIAPLFAWPPDPDDGPPMSGAILTGGSPTPGPATPRPYVTGPPPGVPPMQAVPEPSGLVLVPIGLAALAAARRWRRSTARPGRLPGASPIG